MIHLYALYKDKPKTKLSEWEVGDKQKCAGQMVRCTHGSRGHNLDIKVKLKSTSIKYDKEKCFLMVKATIHNENITCMSINVLCNTAVALWSKKYQQMQGDTNRITIVVEDVNITPSILPRHIKWTKM